VGTARRDPHPDRRDRPGRDLKQALDQATNRNFTRKERNDVGMTPGMSPKDVLAMIKAKNIKAVDIRFCDLFGQWQHFTLPTSMVDDEL
jgi:hypothetical protein